MSKTRMFSVLAAAGAGVAGLVLMAQAQQGDPGDRMQDPPATTAPAAGEGVEADVEGGVEGSLESDAATVEGFKSLKDQVSYAMGLGYGKQMRQQLEAQQDMSTQSFATGFKAAMSGGELKLTPEQMSYAAGATVGRGIKQEMANDTTGQIAPAQFGAGFEAALGEGEAKLTDQQVQQTMNAFQQKMMERQLAEMGGGEVDVQLGGTPQEQDPVAAAAAREQAAANQKKADAFLAQNKDKQGVTTTPGGVQVLVLEEGSGATPEASDVVTVHYTGKLLDGTIFDTSHKARPQPTGGMYAAPLTMPLEDLIPGWAQGLKDVKEGATVRLFIPPSLAYGENAPPSIGPNQLLIFDIELLDVQKDDNDGDGGMDAGEAGDVPQVEMDLPDGAGGGAGEGIQEDVE